MRGSKPSSTLTGSVPDQRSARISPAVPAGFFRDCRQTTEMACFHYQRLLRFGFDRADVSIKRLNSRGLQSRQAAPEVGSKRKLLRRAQEGPVCSGNWG